MRALKCVETETDSSSVLERICVRPPYFSLSRLLIHEPGVASAGIPVEHSLGMEVQPIAAAEAGRHLAILGLCAVASANPRPGRQYYLAQEARIRRCFDEEAGQPAPGLRALARGWMEPNGIGSASVILSNEDDRPVYTLIVRYHVVPQLLFERRFRARKNTVEMQTGIPYLSPPEPELLEINPMGLLSRLNEIRAEWCDGHFQDFPALAVAAVMQCLSGAAGRLLAHRMGSGQIEYAVMAGNVQAEKLAFAGDRVDFSASYLGVEGEDHAFLCRAVANQEVCVGELKVRLRLRN